MRCIAIGSQARLMGAHVSFDLGGDNTSGRRLVERAGFDCKYNPAEVATGTIVLVDRVHSGMLRQPRALTADIARWRDQGARVVVIDGTGKDSLRYQQPDLEVDLFIAPYAGEYDEKNETAHLLAGPRFAPLGADYENLAPHEILTAATKILVSCGGSDPLEISADDHEGACYGQSPRLTVRVVLGPRLRIGILCALDRDGPVFRTYFRMDRGTQFAGLAHVLVRPDGGDFGAHKIRARGGRNAGNPDLAR